MKKRGHRSLLQKRGGEEGFKKKKKKNVTRIDGKKKKRGGKGRQGTKKYFYSLKLGWFERRHTGNIAETGTLKKKQM